MGISYRAYFVIVTDSLDARAPIRSFAPGHVKAVEIDSASDVAMLGALEAAKKAKTITLFKSPTKDDFDAIVTGLYDGKTAFGLNFDIYAAYKDTTRQIAHFFAQDSKLTSQAVKVGSGKNITLKIEAGFEHGGLSTATKVNGVYDDDIYGGH